MSSKAELAIRLAEKMDLPPSLAEEALGYAEPLDQIMAAADLLTRIIRLETDEDARQLAEHIKDGVYHAVDRLKKDLRSLERLQAHDEQVAEARREGVKKSSKS